MMKLTRVLRSTIVAAAIAGALLMAPAAANARVFVSVGFAPPAIPIYAQPIAPGYGYIWTPGYWAYGPDGYYWVDGAWVLPPYEGALWTPGYWGWADDAYDWYPGYWGLNVGFYGGINYGFGYFGTGFYGGYWNGGHFFYNGAYNHIGFHNGFVYNHPVAGFDGRPGGESFARPGAGRTQAFNRSSGINGRAVGGGNFAARGTDSFAANRGTAQVGFRNGVAGNGARPEYNSGATRSFAGGNSPAQAHTSFAAPQAHSFAGGGQAQTRGNFAAPAAQPRSFAAPAAPQARSFSGGGQAQSHASFSGGGGGGGARGGGGGARGGGGHR